MGKIIKSKLEELVVNKEKFSLGMKGEFVVEFVNDTFGPYEYKFAREDCYFNDGLEDRGTKVFPLKNKEFNNTEIFLENDDIIVFTGERGNLSGEAKKFIDIVNINTEKKHRIFTDEVNLIYNGKNSIIVNANLDGIFKTIELDINSLEILSEKVETLLAFFKCVYNPETKFLYLLDFNQTENANFQKGFFGMKYLSKLEYSIISYDREGYKVILYNGEKIDIWELSCK